MSEKKIQAVEDTVIVTLTVGYKDEENKVHKEVEIREITGFDEEAISKADVRANLGKLMTTLLANVTVRIGDLSFKDMSRSKWEKIFRDLTLGDRNQLMLEIRKLSHGNEIELDMKCPHPSCKSKITHIVEIDEDISVVDLEVDPYSIPFELPKGMKGKDGEILKFGTLRLPNGDDQESLDSIARKNPGQANTTLLGRTIVVVDNFGKVGLSDLRGMSVRDRDYLIKLISDNSFGPNFEVSFPCPVCGEDVDAGVHPVNFL